MSRSYGLCQGGWLSRSPNGKGRAVRETPRSPCGKEVRSKRAVRFLSGRAGREEERPSEAGILQTSSVFVTSRRCGVQEVITTRPTASWTTNTPTRTLPASVSRYGRFSNSNPARLWVRLDQDIVSRGNSSNINTTHHKLDLKDVSL